MVMSISFGSTSRNTKSHVPGRQTVNHVGYAALIIALVTGIGSMAFAVEPTRPQQLDKSAFVCGERFVTFRTEDKRVTVLKNKVVLLRGPTHEVQLPNPPVVNDRFIQAYWHHYADQLKKANRKFTIKDLTDYVRRNERENPAVVKQMADDLFKQAYRGRRYSNGDRITRQSFDKMTGLDKLDEFKAEVGAQITSKKYRTWAVTQRTHKLLIRCLK